MLLECTMPCACVLLYSEFLESPHSYSKYSMYGSVLTGVRGGHISTFVLHGVMSLLAILVCLLFQFNSNWNGKQ